MARTITVGGKTLTVLETADDVTPEVLAQAEQVVDLSSDEETPIIIDSRDRKHIYTREVDEGGA